MSTLNSIHLEIVLDYIILTSYYIVKDRFRWKVITAKVNAETNNNIVNKFTTMKSMHYSASYHTYQLLYCKKHIQMISNHSNVNVKIEKNKMITLNSIHLEVYWTYITLLDYYIV